jgi:hypothetical protein
MRVPGVLAVLVAGGSIALGAAYFAYLNATPFPPSLARAIPFAWLAGAMAGIGLGVAAIRARRQIPLGIGAVLLGLPSVAFAAIFAMAAALGD